MDESKGFYYDTDKEILKKNITEIDFCQQYSRWEGEEIKLCNFYLKLCSKLREMGYNGDDWKISLYDCIGKNRQYGITNQKDLRSFNFISENQVIQRNKPYGLWFSNFFEYLEDIQEGVLPSGDFIDSWIKWCIENMPHWVEPEKCKFIIVAKFDKDKLVNMEDHHPRGINDWPAYSKEYAGVNGGWGYKDQKYPVGGWDAPSWVAFNPEAFKEVHLIHFSDIM